MDIFLKESNYILYKSVIFVKNKFSMNLYCKNVVIFYNFFLMMCEGVFFCD